MLLDRELQSILELTKLPRCLSHGKLRVQTLSVRRRWDRSRPDKESNNRMVFDYLAFPGILEVLLHENKRKLSKETKARWRPWSPAR